MLNLNLDLDSDFAVGFTGVELGKSLSASDPCQMKWGYSYYYAYDSVVM